MGGKIYQLNAQTIGRFLRRVELLVCYRCGVELIENQWVFAKHQRGHCLTLPDQRYSALKKNKPKVYHLACAKEVKLID